MNNTSTSKKILTILTLISVSVASLYGFVYWSMYKDSKNVALLITQSSTDFEKNERIRLAKIELAKNDDFISKIDSYFIPKDGVVTFINEIENLGKSANVSTTISSIEPVIVNEKEKDNFKETLSVKLESVGSWQNVYQFVSLLESTPYGIVIDEVQIKLMDSTDTLTFKSASSTVPRIRNSNETWKLVVDFKILKLK